jgi:hypothetical protein
MPQPLKSLKDKVLDVQLNYRSTVPSISAQNTAVADLQNASAP